MSRNGLNALIVAALFAVMLAVTGGRAMAYEGPDHPGDPGVPGAPVGVVSEIGAMYGGAAQSINESLSKAITDLAADAGSSSAQFRRNRAAALLAEIQGAVKRANVTGVKVVSTAHRTAFEAGVTAAQEQCAELGMQIPNGKSQIANGKSGLRTEDPGPFAIGSFTGVNEETVNALARDSVAKMSRGLNEHGERAVGLFRSLSKAMAGVDAQDRVRGFSLSERDVNRVIARGVITGDPREALGLMRKLIGEGMKLSPAVLEDYRKTGNQLIAVGGWTGKVRTYAELVVRTRTSEAQREGQIDRQASLGVDLAQITGSNSSNFCTRFVGLVVVVRGDARGSYPALSDLPGGGPPFHPNCTKNLRAFVAELVDESRVRMHDNAARRYAAAAANGTLMEPIRGVRSGRQAA